MEEKLEEDSPALKSSFYNRVTQAKEDFKTLLNDEHQSENAQKSILGFSPRPSLPTDKEEQPTDQSTKPSFMPI